MMGLCLDDCCMSALRPLRYGEDSAARNRSIFGRRAWLFLMVWWIGLGMHRPGASAQTAFAPGFVLENHSATDGAGTEFNRAVLPLNVTGSNTLLIGAWHAEYDDGDPNNWTVEYAGVPGTLLVATNGYKGGDGNQRFRIYYWLNPAAGAGELVVAKDYDGPNELAVSAILLTNVAQLDPIGDVVVDVSTNDRTEESETVNTIPTDLVVHVIADRLVLRGVLGPDETSRSIANDGSHISDGDASLWIATKPAESPTTTVSSTGWARSVVNGVAIVVHGFGPVPTLSELPNQSTSMNTAATIPFVVGDVDTPVDSLLLTGTSSNPTLVPDSNIVFGGAGVARTVTVIPAAGQTGIAIISVAVSDGVFARSDTFELTVLPGVFGTLSFTNNITVEIPDAGAATPYPSTISVTGLSGKIAELTVRLHNLTHSYPGDVDILLVGPAGQRVILASDAGGTFNLTDVTLSFQDAAAARLPADSQIVAGTFKPTDFGESAADLFPAPAPEGPFATALSVFNTQVAHGTWSLYVVDDGSEDGGAIESWSLTLSTVGEPALSALSDQTILVDTVTPAITFSVSDPDTPVESLTLSGASSNPVLVPDSNIVFGGSGDVRTVTVTPASGQTGTSIISVTVSDGVLSANTAFVLRVNARPAAVSLKAAGRNPNGEFQVQVEGESLAGYVAQVSEDLVQWTDVAPPENVNGTWILTDRESGSYTQRFYRFVHRP